MTLTDIVHHCSRKLLVVFWPLFRFEPHELRDNDLRELLLDITTPVQFDVVNPPSRKGVAVLLEMILPKMKSNEIIPSFRVKNQKYDPGVGWPSP